jgi:hypothetical protein
MSERTAEKRLKDMKEKEFDRRFRAEENMRQGNFNDAGNQEVRAAFYAAKAGDVYAAFRDLDGAAKSYAAADEKTRGSPFALEMIHGQIGRKYWDRINDIAYKSAEKNPSVAENLRKTKSLLDRVTRTGISESFAKSEAGYLDGYGEYRGKEYSKRRGSKASGAAAVIATFGFGAGLIFLSPAITGNVIGPGPETQLTNMIGFVAFVVGLIGASFWAGGRRR